MEYCKIFTTRMDFRALSHTQTHTHGHWWCFGCFGPWRRRHSNHSAITSSSGVQEETQTDRYTLSLSLSLQAVWWEWSFLYFKHNTLRCAGRRKLHEDVLNIADTVLEHVLIISPADCYTNTHTHTADGVISQSTCAERGSRCLNIRLNPFPLDE